MPERINWRGCGMAAVALAGAIAVGAILWLPDPTPLRADAVVQREAPPPAKPAQQHAQPPELTLQRPVQVAGAHGLDYAMSIDLPDTSRAEVRMQASLEIAPELVVGSAVWLPLRLVGAHIQQSDAARAIVGVLAAEALDKPWLVRLETDGRVAEVRFVPDAAPSAVALQVSLSLATQFARPADPTVRQWEVDEQELSGVFRARYARGAGGKVNKARTSSAGQWPSTAATTEFSFVGQQLVAVHASERGTIPLGALMRQPDTQPYRVDVQLRRTGDVPADWADGLDPMAMKAFSPEERAAPDVRPTRPLSDVLAEVGRLQGEAPSHEFVALRDEMARSLRQDPSGIPRVVEALQSRQLQKDAQLIQVAGLVSARTDPALAAVAQMLTSVQTEPVLRGQLLQAATLLDKAPPVLVNAALQLVTSQPNTRVGAAAANTLGALVSATGGGAYDDTGKAALKQMIELGARIVAPATFGRPGDQESRVGIRVGWLGGLSNTAHPAVLPILLAALGESEELVRAHAAFGLRFQNPAPIVDVLVEVMAKEQSGLVRDYLVSAMRWMGPAVTLPLVEKALRHDQSKMVRLTAANVLAVWMSRAPGVRKVLQDALPAEKSVEVAKAIQEYLQPGTSLSSAQKRPIDSLQDPLPTLENDP